MHVRPFLLAALLPAAAVAQQRDTATLAPVTVTASRYPASLERRLAAVAVVSGDDLRARGIVRVEDAIRDLPGISVARAGSYGAQTSLFVRGGQANYTKVLVDGVPLNAPGGAMDLGSLTLDDVERIEVLRGPAGVAWGSDAVTGVVNIVTRNGGGPRGGTGNAALRAGTRGAREGSVDVRGDVGPLRASGGAQLERNDGIYAVNSAWRSEQAQASVGWLAAASLFELSGRFARVEAGSATDVTGAPVDTNDSRTEDRALVRLTSRTMLRSAELTVAATSALIDGIYTAPPDDDLDSDERYGSRSLRQGAEVRARVPVNAATVTVGAAVEGQGGRADSHFESGGFASDERTQGFRRTISGYAEVAGAFPLAVVAVGARTDHSSVYGSFVTTRVAASRSVGMVRVRGAFATGFREPSFAEILPSGFAEGSPDLRPEQSRSWELGVESAPRGVRVAATWFAQRFTNMIDYQPDFVDFVGRYENVARARSNGAELEVGVPISRGLRSDLNWTWLDTKVEQGGFSSSPAATMREGGPLLRRPKHAGSLGFAWVGPFASSDLRAHYVGRREDRRYFNGPPFAEAVVLDPYVRVDYAAEMPLRGPGSAARLHLRVENLLGARYEHVAGYAAAGRSVIGGVRVAF